MPQLTYQVIRSRRLTAGISLSIHPEKGLVVKAPFWVPDLIIRNFVEEKADWIREHQAKIKPALPEKRYEAGEKHLYFGQEYSLVLLPHEIPIRTRAEIVGDELHLSFFNGHLGTKRTEEIKEAILRLYLETGIGILTEKVNYYSSQIGVEYSRIDIKKVSSIWGSCSASNKLSFNRKLIMAPHEVVDYVIIHEVAHLVHRNHSSRFWGLVAQYDPHYREHRRWLHRNHLLLSI